MCPRYKMNHVNTVSTANRVIKFVRDDPKAVVPKKGTEYSIGYDLTAISVFKKISEKTTLFDTGIKIQPPEGYYTEIVPRSSISKTGYMLSNSVGQLDYDFRGRLLIALTKVDEKMPDIALPFTVCQLVLRKAEYPEMVEVESLEDTVRGAGGFGSTTGEGINCGIGTLTVKEVNEILEKSGSEMRIDKIGTVSNTDKPGELAFYVNVVNQPEYITENFGRVFSRPTGYNNILFYDTFYRTVTVRYR